MWDMNDLGPAWWLLMSVGMVAFWALVIVGVVWLARGASAPAQPSAPPPEQSESPLHLLDRRLASGEISVDDYDSLRTVIDDRAPAEPPEAAVR